MPGTNTAQLLTIQQAIKEGLHKWFKYYKSNIYHNKSLDKIENELLFYASFTNLLSESFKEEIHLLAEALFKKEKNKKAWPPFCNHIFIKVLDWTVNGINTQRNDREKKVFDRFILMTYSQNNSIRILGQRFLYCMLSKNNSRNNHLRDAVLLSCRQNLKHQSVVGNLLDPEPKIPTFALDYIVSMISFLDVPKRMKIILFLITVSDVHKTIKDLSRYNNGSHIYLYKCANPFYPCYKELLQAGIALHKATITQDKKQLGVQLKLDEPTAGLKLLFYKETDRISEQIIFARQMIPEMDIQKMINSKIATQVSTGEPVTFIEPPSPTNTDFRN